MRKTENYAPPRVIKESELFLETAILAGSLKDNAEIRAIGHEVEQHNMGDDSCNHNWD